MNLHQGPFASGFRFRDGWISDPLQNIKAVVIAIPVVVSEPIDGLRADFSFVFKPRPRPPRGWIVVDFVDELNDVIDVLAMVCLFDRRRVRCTYLCKD